MKRSERLRVLHGFMKQAADGYGGDEFELPSDHKAGMKVSKGGSSCATCKFGDPRDDGPHCTNAYWVKWNGGDDKIPAPSDEYCSDWWTPKE